ncbi:MAG: chemotaxis protein CheC [Lachnospiraceae bacterium]|nr:chemotaxis protein CheC [Lachnospiraceae bacterium]
MARFENLDDMSSEYYDVLSELGNIGAGNAATALATMLQCKMDITVPKVRLLDFKDVCSVLGGEEQIMAGIDLMVEGDINGSIMFLMDERSAHVLVEKVMGMPTEQEHSLTEMELSALKEVGNIITGAYLNSLATLTSMMIYPSVPYVSIDMAGAILSVAAIEFGIMGDKILMIETQLMDETEINGYFLLMPDLESYDKILSSLGL